MNRRMLCLSIGLVLFFLSSHVLGYLHALLTMEGEIAFRRYAFNKLMDSALQIVRSGKIDRSRSPIPSKWVLPEDVVAEPASIDCTKNVFVADGNASEEAGFRVMLFQTLGDSIFAQALRPFLRKRIGAVIVYFGPVPDLDLVLNRNDSAFYFGNVFLSENQDLDTDYENQLGLRAYSNFFENRSYSWSSAKCAQFSYTIIEEN